MQIVALIHNKAIDNLPTERNIGIEKGKGCLKKRSPPLFTIKKELIHGAKDKHRNSINIYL